MADHETAPQPDIGKRAITSQLLDTLRDPEPMCLGLVEVDRSFVVRTDGMPVAEGERPTGDQLVEAVETRLAGLLRRYDLMSRLDDGSGFMVVFKTLADATMLESRIRAFHEELVRPYDLDDRNLLLRISLGAAVRQPVEDAATLMGRAEAALAESLRGGVSGPVLI